MSLRDWVQHAFAVDPPGPAEPNDAQREVIDRVCGSIVRRQLTTPALMALEMSRPLNYLGSQALHFFHPLISVVLDDRGYEQFANFLEHRGSIEYICRRLEVLEVQATSKRRPAKTEPSAHEPESGPPSSDSGL